MHQHDGGDLLLDAVLVDLDLARLEVGDELIALGVAGDHVGGDQIDGDAERRLRCRRDLGALRGLGGAGGAACACTAARRRGRPMAISNANAPADKNLAVFRMA